MKIPERTKQEELVEYAERLSELYSRTYDPKIRKMKGQFFTPKQVSTYMASLFEIQHNRASLLDPGAGTGILIAAFCEQLISNEKIMDLTINAYENDPNLLPLLQKVLESCKLTLEEGGHNVKYNIYEQDFVLLPKSYM